MPSRSPSTFRVIVHCAAFIVRIRTAQVASLRQAVRGVMPEAHSSHKGSVQSQHRARRQPSSGGKHSMCAAARTRTSSWRPRTHLRRPITMNRLATAWSWPRSRRAPRGTRGRPAAAVVAKLRPGVHDVLMCSTHTVQRVCGFVVVSRRSCVTSLTWCWGDRVPGSQRLPQAPWPKGMSAMWWTKSVFHDYQYVSSTAYPDLVDHRRFFWSPPT